MKATDYMILIGAAAAAGTVIGALTDRKRPIQGGLRGAAAGLVAGSVAAGVYGYAARQEVPFYSSLSPLYDEYEVV